MDERTKFPVALYALAQTLTVLSLITKPTPYRWLFFPPVACLYCYLVFFTTTGNILTDVGIGGAILTQLLIAADYIIFTDSQNELRKNDQTEPISDKPLMERVWWALHLFTSSRGVGWTHASTSLPKPTECKSRMKFVVLRLRKLAIFHTLNYIAKRSTTSNPALIDVESASLAKYGLYWRVTGVFAFASSGMLEIDILHCWLSMIVVAIGLSEPQDWPDLYGSVWNAYTVQRFWGRTWHQLLRRPLSSTTNIIVNNVLCLPKNSVASSLAWILTAFSISGLIHAGGEYMMLGSGGFGALCFFLLQGVAVVCERVVMMLGSKAGLGGNSVISRLVGYVWVACWFVWSVPIIVDPMIKAEMFSKHHSLFTALQTTDSLQYTS